MGTRLSNRPRRPDGRDAEHWKPLDWPLTIVGLYVFTFAVVTFRFPVAEIGIVIALIGLFLQPTSIRIPPLVWIYSSFVLWCFVVSFASQFPEVAHEQVLERLKQAIIILVVVNALQTERQIRAYLIFFLGCFLLYPARGALVNYVRGYNVFGRALWNFIYSNPNDLAVLALLALGPALVVAASKSGRRQIQLGASIGAALLVIVILLTQSRGAFLGLISSIGLAAAWSVLKGRSRISIVFAAVVSIGILMPSSLWDRLGGIGRLTSTETIATADTEGSAGERWKIQKVAWKIFSDHPLLGVGLGAYPYVNGIYSPELGRRDTHNTYLNLAAEVGLPGLLGWIAFFVPVLLRARRMRLAARSGEILMQQVWLERALLGFMVAALFGTYAALTVPALMLGVLWCSTDLMSQTVVTVVTKLRASGR